MFFERVFIELILGDANLRSNQNNFSGFRQFFQGKPNQQSATTPFNSSYQQSPTNNATKATPFYLVPFITIWAMIKKQRSRNPRLFWGSVLLLLIILIVIIAVTTQHNQTNQVQHKGPGQHPPPPPPPGPGPGPGPGR